MKLGMKVFFILSFGAVCASMKLEKDRTITKVVKLLDNMLAKSKTEAEEESTIYGKFKCYCDKSIAEKSASIKKLSKQITLLEAKIEEVQGDNGELSSDVANLNRMMNDNKAGRDAAAALRKQENEAFVAEETDLKAAFEQMKAAIEQLAEVGADQTSGASDGHKKFMAGKSSLSQTSSALAAASAYMSPEQKSATASFLEKPFTGTYTSQSAQILGNLKNMRDNFKGKLEEIQGKEKTAVASHKKFMDTKSEAYDQMSNSYDTKQKALGENDGVLSAKRSQLAQATKSKASDEDSLEKTTATCKEKTDKYEKRKQLRANEDASIAECISILNSDESFSAFGTASATSTGETGPSVEEKSLSLSYLQLSAVHRHLDANELARKKARKVIEGAKSARLSKIGSLLQQAANPFGKVLGEIETMMQVINKEGEEDKKKLQWCEVETETNNKGLESKKADLLELDEQIDKLTNTISHNTQGLLVQIQETESSILKNTESQKKQTEERTEANVAYQADIKNLVQVQELLAKAIKVLKSFYDGFDKKLAAVSGHAGEALVQEGAWKGDAAYKGQSVQGNSAIEMLQFIESESKKEETAAHTDENQSQHMYEDAMADMKNEMAQLQKSLSKLQATLAVKQKELLEATTDRKMVTADKKAVEAYLEKIKPGCDFITKNFDLRVTNRKSELKSLSKAVVVIKDTPIYRQFVAEARANSFGKCKAKCVEDESTAECKACLADVTVVAYCAGHKGTKGCAETVPVTKKLLK